MKNIKITTKCMYQLINAYLSTANELKESGDVREIENAIIEWGIYKRFFKRVEAILIETGSDYNSVCE